MCLVELDNQPEKNKSYDKILRDETLDLYYGLFTIVHAGFLG